MLPGRDDNPTRETSLVSRCSGIHLRVAYTASATPAYPKSLPSAAKYVWPLSINLYVILRPTHRVVKCLKI
ncbi:hypothetical protein RSOLAG1IB_09110 [Rhizoctonia solani AG-1 IB]|uniref:Uncharacterized protein n=1 Tax=Thanatephorus cucumeris (strain AG1-IB / isolate 7/3/14) TaxID=1108050 RepID=A0A0B7FSD1_THACB|nr:hypothetical protein RSOLAG1IB_09110 [Rhizoctonia solani AG-1 IB]